MPIGNIRKTLSDNSAALQEGGAAALGTLVLGGSKAEAAMAGVGQAIATKLMGPLGKFAGLAYMATKSIWGMTKAWATMGTTSSSKLEKLRNQLRVVLKGLDAAKQRVNELRKFSISAPFKLDDIARGNRALESLTKGALSTKEAMTQIGDAAAQAGVGFEDMATYVARLYDGLAAGRPVGEVLMRLTELGVVSGQARSAIEQLQESGAGFSEVWRVVDGELKRSAGTMELSSKSLETLQSTLEDTQDELKATFSDHFMEGQKEAIQAQIKTLDNLKPAVDGLGSAYGGVVSVMNTFMAKAMAWVTSIPGISTALNFLGRMAGVAAFGITALAIATGTSALVGHLSALTNASGLAARALGLLGVASKGVANSLKLMVTGPFAVLTVMLAVVVGLWSMNRDRVLAAAAAQREYAGATDALIAKLGEQRAAIKSLDALSAAYQSTLSQLAATYREGAQAYAEMEAAAKRGDAHGANAAQDRALNAAARIKSLKAEAALLDKINRNGLEKDSFHAANNDAMAGNKRAEDKAALDAARQTMSPQEREASLAKEAEELAARRGRALQENTQIDAARQAKMGVGERLRKNQTEQAQVQGVMDANFNGDGEEYQKAAAAMQALKAAEQALIQEELTLGEASGSEIVKLQDRLSLLAKYESQAAAVRAAEVALREAIAAKTQAQVDEDTILNNVIDTVDDALGLQKTEAEKVKEATKAIEEKTAALAAQKSALEALEEANQKQGIDPAKAQEMRAEIERRKRELQQDLLNRPEETGVRAALEQEKRSRRRSQMESGGDLRNVEAQEEGGAMAAAKMQIKTERERLDLQKEYKEIDDQVYANRRAALDAEERMLDKRRAIAGLENQAGVKASRYDLQAKALRLRGKGREADALEERGMREKEDAGLERRVQEIMDETGMAEGDARGQAKGEINTARQGRALDKEGGLLQALLGRGQVVDSLQKVGGGGGVGSGPDVKKVLDRLDRLIDAVQSQKTGDLRL